MLTDTDLERLFAERKTPEAGRRLIRELRINGPVRKLQHRMDTVRTRFISNKMGRRALYAESRTVELPGIVYREHDKTTRELWPQPCDLDLMVGTDKGKTRLQHTPDLFLITDFEFVMEEWREEVRLLKFAAEYPDRFYKDAAGAWHYAPAEAHLEKLGIRYHLRSADEHPYKFIANLRFLEDYCLESVLPAPEAEVARLKRLLDDRKHIAHTELVYEHKFNADHIFQMMLNGDAYVDLHEVTLRQTGDLVIYRDQVIAQADGLMRRKSSAQLPTSALALRVGAEFHYEGTPYKVVLIGRENVHARDSHGASTELPIELVRKLFEQGAVSATQQQPPPEREYDPSVVLANARRLEEAMQRLAALQDSKASTYSERSIRRFREAIRGIASPQDQLKALMPCNDGNRTQRLPDATLKLAELALKEHNAPEKPTVFATFSRYITQCDDHDVMPMSKSAFYEWIKRRESVAAREGRRMAYQKAPIALHYDYEHPVHGVLPHEVAYCDHTTLNIFLKGERLPNLGKATFTLMFDGAMHKARAFFLSYRPPGTFSVLMCLRDYVRRNGRLPKVLVLDNGKEFHSEAVKAVCSMFGIEIRWRRRSKPRDSTLVERMLGATEVEVLSALSGNTIALKNPRMVSSSHNPEKHIEWTLPALHGALNHYLFDVHPSRIHPKLKLSPNDYEERTLRECGTREHIFVRYDKTLKLLTAPHSGNTTRVVDRIRGIYVDGQYYWNDRLALAKKAEHVEVRVEPWCARVVYVCFRDEWLIAQARDGGRLEGRFRDELEQQKREENRRAQAAAANDKKSVKQSRKRVALWTPEVWDERLREQRTEEYLVYEKLGMTEVLPEARNPRGGEIDLGLPRGSDIPLVTAIQREPDIVATESQEGPSADPTASTTDAEARPAEDVYF